MQFITSCVESTYDLIHPMVEEAREITYRTFFKHVRRDLVAPVFPAYDWRRRPRDLTLKRDWHVSYHKSRFGGRTCYYIRHSAIEYVFA